MIEIQPFISTASDAYTAEVAQCPSPSFDPPSGHILRASSHQGSLPLGARPREHARHGGQVSAGR